MACVIASRRMDRSCFRSNASGFGHGSPMFGAIINSLGRHRHDLYSLLSRSHIHMGEHGIRAPTKVTTISVADVSSTPNLLHRQLHSCRSTTLSGHRVRHPAVDRDVVVSVLEASATRRDAMNYLQKYAPKFRSSNGPAQVIEARPRSQMNPEATEPTNVAIVVLRTPQKLESNTLSGIAKTLTQLRALGLLSVIVIDCGVEEDSNTFQDEALRLCEAIDSFGKPGVKLAHSILTKRNQLCEDSLPDLWDEVLVEDQGLINRALQNDMMVIIPSISCHGETLAPQPNDARQTIMALTKYFTGMQLEASGENSTPRHDIRLPLNFASVERIIILDMLGGTPVPGRPGVCQRFVNLKQEYDTLLRYLEGLGDLPSTSDNQIKLQLATHASNLKLAKDTLAILPVTSSALITTPYAAADRAPATASAALLAMNDSLKFGMVTTRNRQNPLLHNLLTDKPVFSSSLPIQRLQIGNENFLHAENPNEATLVKKGMPLTMYPDPVITPWALPEPGSRRLQLTDSCIDLSRLVNLIEDSFGRKLDVDGYLSRVNENLAGVIIAGEYEGVAILTWEQPSGLDASKAYLERRFVPYLDKFAVLKSRQGSGGVADMVFNAIVRDCFPRGVCWRSRKNNPVNRWYFERSSGTSKLPDSDWTMFWTTPMLASEQQTLQDYEAVCRQIVPSWAESRRVLT